MMMFGFDDRVFEDMWIMCVWGGGGENLHQAF